MAITYPRALPDDIGQVTSAFNLVWGNVNSRTRRNRVESTEWADPFWTCSITTEPKFEDPMLRLQTWFDSLRGGQKSFLAHDGARPFPLRYPAGFDGLMRGARRVVFDGTAVVTALSAYRLNLALLPADFQLSEGDYIGISEGSSRHLHRVTEAVTGEGHGIVAVSVEPFVITNLFTKAAIVNFARPSIEFLPGVMDAPRTREAAPATFTGVQLLR